MAKQMLEENRKALEQKVNVGEEALNEALSALADNLSKYGFKGRLKLKLFVSIVDPFFGNEDVNLERSTTLKLEK